MNVYFQPVQDDFEIKILDWLEVYISNQYKVVVILSRIEIRKEWIIITISDCPSLRLNQKYVVFQSLCFELFGSLGSYATSNPSTSLLTMDKASTSTPKLGLKIIPDVYNSNSTSMKCVL